MLGKRVIYIWEEMGGPYSKEMGGPYSKETGWVVQEKSCVINGFILSIFILHFINDLPVLKDQGGRI